VVGKPAASSLNRGGAEGLQRAGGLNDLREAPLRELNHRLTKLPPLATPFWGAAQVSGALRPEALAGPGPVRTRSARQCDSAPSGGLTETATKVAL
jgi:hypothetical protein